MIGIGEEPLAVDHIVVNCIARNSVSQSLKISNPYKDKSVVYEIDSDLSCFECDIKTFTILPSKIYNLQFFIRPSLGGVYGGSLTLYEHDNKDKFIWYTIVVNADRPRNEQ